MEMFIEQGENLMDCKLKIAEKYKRPFTIMNQKDVKLKGFLGLFSKPGVEVEFYFTPLNYKNYSGVPAANTSQRYMNVYDAQVLANAPPDLESEKRKVLAAAGKSYEKISAAGKDASKQILDSLEELKKKIEKTEKKEEHASFAKAAKLLKLNDFSESYIEIMLERMRKELSYGALEDENLVQDKLLEWIGESISIYKEEEAPRKPKILVLIGPTGVGKTTTLAKLAAFYGISADGYPAMDVRVITIDGVRIGALDQLEKICAIMQIPVSFVDEKQALKKEIALHSHIDMFLIDTFGSSPKDASKIGQMKDILDGAGRQAEFHLAICAGTKAGDIENILRQFEPFNYKSVLLTKMDETQHIGNVISVLAEKRKSISYITDGQSMPADIRKATVVYFLINLEGFKVNRDKIERLFPPGAADQFKWR